MTSEGVEENVDEKTIGRREKSERRDRGEYVLFRNNNERIKEQQ